MIAAVSSHKGRVPRPALLTGLAPTLRRSFAILALPVLAGCAIVPQTPSPPQETNAAPPAPIVAPPPRARPKVLRAARPDPRPLTVTRADRAQTVRAAIRNAPAPSERSRKIATYLQSVERALLARGRLRADDSTAPPSASDLARDFVDIALHDEYQRQGDALIAQARPSALRRWRDPVRIKVEFGPSLTPGARIRDRAAIAGFADRLGRISGHPVSLTTGDDANFTVLVLTEDERRDDAERLRTLVPQIPASDLRALRDLSLQNYCTVFAYSRGGDPVYHHAVALIRAELPPRLRLSCIHEELAQGMGLANDSLRAHPSIFNDDEEYALLTRHDELLLKMLYDERLRPGMSAEEAAPIIAAISKEFSAEG